MTASRAWCRQCSAVAGPSCEGSGHALHRIGTRSMVDVCVLDRRHTLRADEHGYYNMVGHSAGRTPLQQEAHTRRRIAEMRKQDMQQRRERRIHPTLRDNPTRVGAIPSALLFAYKRKYGDDYLQHVEQFMRREGLWWGER